MLQQQQQQKTSELVMIACSDSQKAGVRNWSSAHSPHALLAATSSAAVVLGEQPVTVSKRECTSFVHVKKLVPKGGFDRLKDL